MSYYIGQMSGTSLDGIDTVLMRFDKGQMTLLAQHHLDFDLAMKASILALCDGSQDELHRAYMLSNELSKLYASSVQALLEQHNIPRGDISAIGCHGQTVRHRPPAYSVQLINGALLAETCGIDVVCDFRSRDMAAGGQGAPLVPAFHRVLFQQTQNQAQAQSDTFVVNIGGMANISRLTAAGGTEGHDTGPGNVLMDAWCQQHLNQPFDKDGAWAASGQLNTSLLAQLLREEFFKLPPPKSTGRELFDLEWLQRQLDAQEAIVPTADVMTTITQLTVESIAREIEQLSQRGRVIVCGGGALNLYLMSRLTERLPRFGVLSSAELGHDPQCIEAMAFAWLAKQCIEREVANVPQVTGAKGGRILGAIYPR